ncbi:MAG: DUF4157 domain-containing protein [Thermomicrobiales bacterium]
MHGRDPVDLMVKNSGAIRRRGVDAAAEVEAGPEQHPLLKLQRQVGNATVSRMLAQRQGPEEEEIQAKHDPSVVQRQGPEEEEIQAKHDPSMLQRQGMEDEEIQAKHDPAFAQREGEEDELQAKHDPALAQRSSGEGAAPEVGLEGGPISDALSGRIQSKRGGGSALDGTTQSSMEGAFGTQFDDVRVHHDDESDALNRSISAKAFTTGSDIFFSRGASPSDSPLLSHELTHVVQQRSMSHSGPMSVGPAGDSHEQAADSVSASINSGATASAQRELEDGLAPAGIAREAAPDDEEMM